MTRRWVRGGLATLLVLVALAVAAGLWLTRDPAPYFAARRAPLVRAVESPLEWDGEHWIQTVDLESASGLRVTITLKGDTVEGPRPLFVILGGHRTGKDAARLIPDVEGRLVAAMAYPFEGNHRAKGLAVLREVPAIRRAIRDTPPAAQLALDYLMRRPEVDTSRVEGVGVSLGAWFMSIVAARDERVRRLWIVHGSGGVRAPLEHNLRRSIPFRPASAAVGALAAVLAGGPAWAPERWIGDVAPRPVVLIAARDDERLPREAVLSLWESAREPKQLIWVDGPHVRGSRTEQVRALAGMVMELSEDARVVED